MVNQREPHMSIVERSAGTVVTVGVIPFVVGGGYRGATDDLDNAVQAGADALRDLFNHDVVIRFNSDRLSGGSWLKTNPDISSFYGNCEVGIGASLFDLDAAEKRHADFYRRYHYGEDRSADIAEEIGEMRKRWNELGYDLNGPRQQVLFTAYIKRDYLRDPAAFVATERDDVLYTHHRTLTEAVEHVRHMAANDPDAITEVLRQAAAERRQARILLCETAIAALSKKALIAILGGIDFKYRRDLWSLESATKPVLRSCIVKATAANDYTYDPAHHAGIK
jgi:hypothetical protein